MGLGSMFDGRAAHTATPLRRNGREETPSSGTRVMEFEFKLTYQLSGSQPDADQLLTKLGEEGCTDALVELGVAGQVDMEFVRAALTAEEALNGAIEDIKRTLPKATLVEAAPKVLG